MKTSGLLVLIISAALSGCVKPFTPAQTTTNPRYLVVDGIIAPGAANTIKLSRTGTVAGNDTIVPENGAEVSVESASGTIYSYASLQNGVYTSPVINADGSYRLHIRTAEGKEYISDEVEMKVAPAIDSVYWEEDKDIFIYVDAHDDQAKTKYYRWQFDETVEYHAVYDSNLDYRDGQLVFIGPDEYRFACFKYYPSHEILVSNSGSLDKDVISRFLLARIPNDNSKISFRYSMLVKQYAISAEAYQYWNIVKQNTEQTGKIFDPQPAQIYGNIKNVNDPNEPVIGFLSASTVSEQRLFITQSQLSEIVYPDIDLCKEVFINPLDATSYLRDGKYLPAYIRMSDHYVAIAAPECVDCRLSGGTTTKPAYW